MGEKGCSLLIRNLSFETSPEKVRRIFEHFGKIRDVYLPLDHYTRRPRGFGFVEYYDPKYAKEALNILNNSKIDGKEIRIIIAQNRRKSPDTMKMYHHNGTDSRYRAPRHGSRRSSEHSSRQRSRHRSRRKSRHRSRRRSIRRSKHHATEKKRIIHGRSRSIDKHRKRRNYRSLSSYSRSVSGTSGSESLSPSDAKRRGGMKKKKSEKHSEKRRTKRETTESDSDSGSSSRSSRSGRRIGRKHACRRGGTKHSLDGESIEESFDGKSSVSCASGEYAEEKKKGKTCKKNYVSDKSRSNSNGQSCYEHAVERSKDRRNGSNTSRNSYLSNHMEGNEKETISLSRSPTGEYSNRNSFDIVRKKQNGDDKKGHRIAKNTLLKSLSPNSISYKNKIHSEYTSAETNSNQNNKSPRGEVKNEKTQSDREKEVSRRISDVDTGPSVKRETKQNNGKDDYTNCSSPLDECADGGSVIEGGEKTGDKNELACNASLGNKLLRESSDGEENDEKKDHLENPTSVEFKVDCLGKPENDHDEATERETNLKNGHNHVDKFVKKTYSVECSAPSNEEGGETVEEGIAYSSTNEKERSSYESVSSQTSVKRKGKQKRIHVREKLIRKREKRKHSSSKSDAASTSSDRYSCKEFRKNGRNDKKKKRRIRESPSDGSTGYRKSRRNGEDKRIKYVRVKLGRKKDTNGNKENESSSRKKGSIIDEGKESEEKCMGTGSESDQSDEDSSAERSEEASLERSTRDDDEVNTGDYRKSCEERSNKRRYKSRGKRKDDQSSERNRSGEDENSRMGSSQASDDMYCNTKNKRVKKRREEKSYSNFSEKSHQLGRYRSKKIGIDRSTTHRNRKKKKRNISEDSYDIRTHSRSSSRSSPNSKSTFSSSSRRKRSNKYHKKRSRKHGWNHKYKHEKKNKHKERGKGKELDTSESLSIDCGESPIVRTRS
ncbi:RNA-binding protein, putative [Plasmodium ovale wallikeri]|uniref:RNA-binding protein, putative n=2 Tax=Plasmodium ovale TaxID=36330 RepID=A0A1A8YV24_PLAOA|nr:RNA-binding protein, putative [Plasmodium ovale wallikeri]SBT35837.1 RNA-binding protein, putative [Plasmodium ovale wallikeri]SBT77149.1 RNA-binding protein, putative [Plasmodium ovale]